MYFRPQSGNYLRAYILRVTEIHARIGWVSDSWTMEFIATLVWALFGKVSDTLYRKGEDSSPSRSRIEQRSPDMLPALTSKPLRIPYLDFSCGVTGDRSPNSESPNPDTETATADAHHHPPNL